MTQSPPTRPGLAIAAILACLLAPASYAQDAAPAQQPAQTTPAPQDITPAAPAQDPAPTGDSAEPASPGTTAAQADPASPATPENPPAATVPTPPATSEPAAPAGEFLPRSMQDALAPLLTPPARDPNLPHDLSPMGMFWAADIVVKAVMIGLALASVITWTVLVVKALELWGASAAAQGGIRRIQRADSLSAAVTASNGRRDAVSRMIRSAAEEYRRSQPALDVAGDAGLKERVESQLDRIEAVAGRRMGRGTGVLATIGSTAPFVGLFGTVWGIMNSFIGISESQTTNLAVVAPGIAEALLATAIGLVAAIPAVVIYNVFARGITGYRLRLANAAAGVRQLVSRDLDFRGLTAQEG